MGRTAAVVAIYLGAIVVGLVTHTAGTESLWSFRRGAASIAAMWSGWRSSRSASSCCCGCNGVKPPARAPRWLDQRPPVRTVAVAPKVGQATRSIRRYFEANPGVVATVFADRARIGGAGHPGRRRPFLSRHRREAPQPCGSSLGASDPHVRSASLWCNSRSPSDRCEVTERPVTHSRRAPRGAF